MGDDTASSSSLEIRQDYGLQQQQHVSGDALRVVDYLPPPPRHGEEAHILKSNNYYVQHLTTDWETLHNNNNNNNYSNDMHSPPTLEALMDEVRMILNADVSSSTTHINAIAIAGEGEPTLRPRALLALTRELSSSSLSSLPIRVVTNGIVHESAAGVMAEHGVRGVSVALMSASPRQYQEIMQTHGLDDFMSCSNGCGEMVSSWSHVQVCKFIKEAIRVGLDVELTGVDVIPSVVDKEATESLGRDLGVKSKLFRWRPYFL